MENREAGLCGAGLHGVIVPKRERRGLVRFQKRKRGHKPQRGFIEILWLRWRRTSRTHPNENPQGVPSPTGVLFPFTKEGALQKGPKKGHVGWLERLWKGSSKSFNDAKRRMRKKRIPLCEMGAELKESSWLRARTQENSQGHQELFASKLTTKKRTSIQKEKTPRDKQLIF